MGYNEGQGIQVWILIPVKVESTSAPSQPLSKTNGSNTLPSRNGDITAQSSARTQNRHAEYECDDIGTVVTEITTTTTATTRKKYRVEDA